MNLNRKGIILLMVFTASASLFFYECYFMFVEIGFPINPFFFMDLKIPTFLGIMIISAIFMKNHQRQISKNNCNCNECEDEHK